MRWSILTCLISAYLAPDSPAAWQLSFDLQFSLKALVNLHCLITDVHMSVRQDTVVMVMALDTRADRFARFLVEREIFDLYPV